MRWLSVVLVAGCGGTTGSPCGPTEAVVSEVIDGDTVILSTGERVRYLMVDTNEITNGSDDCYGEEARLYNVGLVEGKTVSLRYDVECEDRFGRLLAWVTVGGVDVNASLVDEGLACALYIPPNGEDRKLEFDSREARARGDEIGMWGACDVVACDE
jgi:micrococcal nuclease